MNSAKVVIFERDKEAAELINTYLSEFESPVSDKVFENYEYIQNLKSIILSF